MTAFDLGFPGHYTASDLAWQEDALCAQTDPEAFFPEKGASTADAKRVCMACDVRPECLQYALDNDERHGVWGGLSERQRRKIAAGESTADSVDRRRERDRGIARENAEGASAEDLAAKYRLGLRTVQDIIRANRGEAA